LVLPSKQTRVFEGKGPHSVAEPRPGVYVSISPLGISA
jgi:hypothetical protein